MRCGVTTSYLCYINLMDGIEIFSFKNRGILIFRPFIKVDRKMACVLYIPRRSSSGSTFFNHK